MVVLSLANLSNSQEGTLRREVRTCTVDPMCVVPLDTFIITFNKFIGVEIPSGQNQSVGVYF